MRLPCCLALLALLFATSAFGADGVGFRHARIADPVRPLDVAIWYPTAAAVAPILIGDNAALVGEAVQDGAPLAAGTHRLVLLSHGYGGNWSNQAWLATALARHGYVVAAPNHPGTTSRDLHPARVPLAARPRDLSRVIDFLASDAAWKGRVETGKVAAIGHSLGGWTVIALGGGRFDPARFDADCKEHGALAACRVGREMGKAVRPVSDWDVDDARIGAVVTLDLGLARGFDPDSLARFRVPVLVIAAGGDGEGIPAELESGYLIGHLPPATTRSLVIAGAAHFSFLPFCKPGAVALLEADQTGDGVICRDGAPGSRAAVHAETIAQVLHFLADAAP